MKRTIMTMGLALLFTLGMTAQPQHPRKGNLNKEVIAKERTESMVMQYGLNKKQTQELYDLNLWFAQQFPTPRPGGPHRGPSLKHEQPKADAHTGATMRADGDKKCKEKCGPKAEKQCEQKCEKMREGNCEHKCDKPCKPECKQKCEEKCGPKAEKQCEQKCDKMRAENCEHKADKPCKPECEQKGEQKFGDKCKKEGEPKCDSAHNHMKKPQHVRMSPQREKEIREEYNKRLQKIMTKKQYNKYLADEANRH